MATGLHLPTRRGSRGSVRLLALFFAAAGPFFPGLDPASAAGDVEEENAWISAVRNGEDGTITLVYRNDRGELHGLPGFERLRWDRFRLRRPTASGAGTLGVRDAGEDPFPHLELIQGARIVAFHSDVPERSGIAAIGRGRVEVLLDDSSPRYRLAGGGCSVSHDGDFVAAVSGVPPAGILILDLRRAFPAARSVSPPEETPWISPKTLTLTADAAFFAARGPEEGWHVFRVGLAALDEGGFPGTVERIAGPFGHVDDFFASSLSGVAFLAGKGVGAVDVFAAGEQGPAVNVTRSPEDILAHSPDEPRLAVSEHGSLVAFNVRTPTSSELILQDVNVPGEAGRLHITSDAWFHPYIDQESLIFFSETQLVFAGGHEPTTTDLFRVSLLDRTDIGNLTRSAGSATPPFRLTGTLDLHRAECVGTEILLVEAGGFQTGASESLVLISSATGEEIGVRTAATGVSELFSVGSTVHFRAMGRDGRWRLYRIGSNGIESLMAADAGTRPCLLLQTEDRAFYSVPGTGILELSAETEPRVLAADAQPLQPGLLSGDGSGLIIGLESADAVQYVVVDLGSGSSRPLLRIPREERLLEALDLDGFFLRGDANASGRVDMSDVIGILQDRLAGEPAILCPDGADADDDGRIRISDAVYALHALFAGGPGFPEPFPVRGTDPTPDGLGCPVRR